MATKTNTSAGKQCLKCQRRKEPTKNFYKSYSHWHTDSLLPLCKDCLKDFIKDREDNASIVQDLMRTLDKPLKLDTWKQAMESKKETLGEYFRILNLNAGEENYDDSDHLSDKKPQTLINKQKQMFEDINVHEEINELNEEDVKFMKSFWGKYDLEELVWLQKEYEDWTNRYECDSKGMETLIQEICKQQLDINTRRANGEKVDQLLKTLQDLLGSSNLKPVQETGANAVEQESFGTLIKKFEREHPIPEPDQIWADVDGIGKYIRTFFFGHMAKAIGIENKFQKEYDDEVSKYTVKQEDLDGEEDE